MGNAAQQAIRPQQMLLTDHFIEGLGADAIREGCCHGRYLLGMGLCRIRVGRRRRSGCAGAASRLVCGAPVLKTFLLLLF